MVITGIGQLLSRAGSSHYLITEPEPAKTLKLYEAEHDVAALIWRRVKLNLNMSCHQTVDACCHLLVFTALLFFFVVT